MELLNNIDKLLIDLGVNPQTAGWMDQFIAFALVLVVAFTADMICRKILLKAIARLVQKTKATWDDIMFDRNVMVHLSRMVAPVIIYLCIPIAFAGSTAMAFVQRLCLIYIIVTMRNATSNSHSPTAPICNSNHPEMNCPCLPP